MFAPDVPPVEATYNLSIFLLNSTGNNNVTGTRNCEVGATVEQPHADDERL
jgi:hypothetical protein